MPDRFVPRVLVIPRGQAPALPESGCWPVSTLDFLQPALWRVRAQVELDEILLQPVVYLVLLSQAGQAWGYQRSGGDARLDGRCSCRVGGQVDDTDAATSLPFNADDTLRRAPLREPGKELQATEFDLHDLRLEGLIYEGLSAVGRVHLGVLYTAQWRQAQAPQPRPGEALRGLGFMDLSVIAADSRFELWSRLAAWHLMS